MKNEPQTGRGAFPAFSGKEPGKELGKELWQESPEAGVWDYSVPGREGVALPDVDVPGCELPPGIPQRKELPLPEISELDAVRHFTRLSRLNYSIDTHFYPLGSCTMKYNPRISEKIAALPGFSLAHPLLPEFLCQGSLEIMELLQNFLAEISGFQAISLQPAAGAHGELCGVMMIRAYHQKNGDSRRLRMLIPDSAHGTNPASVAMCGFQAVQVPSDSRGNIDIQALKSLCDDTLAGLMLTNPNTLGLFEERLTEAVEAVHNAGGLVYGDGANLNALLGVFRPGDAGIDVMHFNLHKTFGTPHGGGGPGAGPVGAGRKLAPFLPGPRVLREGTVLRLAMPENSIGRVKAFYGNFSVLVKACTFIAMLGAKGLRAVSENAVLNANYLKKLIERGYSIPYNRTCMHEFVASGHLSDTIHALDVAKRLIDYGCHPPTIYFPLIVKEALMIEPTESESRKTLEAFADAMLAIAEEARHNPDIVKTAPHGTPVGRLDEVSAARNPVLKHSNEKAP
ncbi:MAG: aminomethyl-transferring glycine dehydrogenase subunit GcvPB [Spirochaetales bacterium]|nr:aminomethyl-transferring glycine dehydrogenase subunit GcvPB [Spirochaetales bacterium]